MTIKLTTMAAVFAAGIVLLASELALAAGQYGPGVSDTEIKIGNTMPYSGPASATAPSAKSEAAYFAMINDQGGINGRKINFISRDDGYSPPKTVEQCASWSNKTRCCCSSNARHADQQRDPELPERQQGAATVRRHRRRQVE